jgi:hypothetical protein
MTEFISVLSFQIHQVEKETVVPIKKSSSHFKREFIKLATFIFHLKVVNASSEQAV